jgi:pimeloyl-ACP methyl ester carboxylesterase
MRETTWQDLLEPGKATDFFAHPPAPFQPDAAAYNDANAWWLAELSRLVYRHEGRTPFLDRAGLDEVKFFDAKETECFVVRARDGKWAALVFRGTENLRDWLTNVDVKRVPAPAGEVHEGFNSALDAVWRDVAPVLATLDCPIFYAGHSLGAALATLAASRRAPRATYTYGSPLVGDKAFAASLGATPLFRVVNDLDIVTTVPPPLLGYHHAGELHTIGERKPVRGFVFDSLEKFRELANPPEPLADHAPINYVELIGARL